MITQRGRLAIDGGDPVRKSPFPEYRTIGEEEKRAAMAVLDSGSLSEFLGAAGPQFLGGPRVRDLEARWSKHFGVTHSITVNSATSGLYAAIGASGVGPGDEVIVSPYTMSASAVGVLLYGATPVFADIDPVTYCISPATIEAVLTPRTKAILVVDLFGHPADFDGIMRMARRRGITVIEDAAQAPGSTYKGRHAGTLGDIGVFSLNYHKAIHSGEGGVVCTDDDRLAERVRLIRNHAEAVVTDDHEDDAGLIGFNYRMTEISAAIATEQLRKLEGFLQGRIERANVLRERWSRVPGLHPAVVRDGCRHGFYVLAVQYDADVVGAPRAEFIRAVHAEGVPLSAGYVKPLYLQPIYQRRAFHCGPNCPDYHGSVSYAEGICPTTEAMYRERLFYTTLFHPGLSFDDIDDVARAVEKVAVEFRRSRDRRPL